MRLHRKLSRQKPVFGPSAATGESPKIPPLTSAQAQVVTEWQVERADRILDSVKQFSQNGLDTLAYDDVYPLPQITWTKDSDYLERAVLTKGYSPMLYGRVTLFKVKGKRVPDWLYGYSSIDQATCVPENGTADEIKDSITNLIQDSLAIRARAIRDVLEYYKIEASTFEADFVNRVLSVEAVARRPVMEVNMIMTNQKVRNALSGRTVIKVKTRIEETRRTDGYLKDKKPEYQVLQREFTYENGLLRKDLPENWSAGTDYAKGDTLAVGPLYWTMDGDWDSRAAVPAPRGRSNEGRRDHTAHERAYLQSARNR